MLNLLAFVTPLPPENPPSKFELVVQYTEIANLTYELDVVTGLLPQVDPNPYRELWESRFLTSQERRHALARWRDIRRKYDATVTIEGGFVNLADSMRIAGLRSKTSAEYVENVALLLDPVDAEAIREVIETFLPDFHRWFEREPKSKGKSFSTSLQKMLTGNPIRGDIEAFARFYAPTLGKRPRVVFSLLYRPSASGSTTGQQLRSVAAVEFRADEKPEERIDVVIHELCHFLFASRSSASSRSLSERLYGLNDASAKGAYNLMNEGLATALGNGIVARRFSKPASWQEGLDRPLSFYNNPNIDRAGKALLKLADQWIPAGRTMEDPDFAASYLQSLKAEFGSELERPKTLLMECFLYVDATIGREGLDLLRSTFQPASVYATIAEQPNEESLKELSGHEDLSAVLLVAPNQVEALVATGVLPKRALGLIADAYQAQGSVLYGHTRNAQARTYVIVAKDMESVKRRISQLAGLAAHFNGIAPEDK